MQNFKQFLKENEYHDIIITDEDLVNGKLKKQYPDINGYFDCSNRGIITLKFAPKYVGGYFNCYNTKITSLKGIGKDYLKEVKGIIYLNDCHELKSNMLGLLLVKGLQRIYFDNNEIEEIFNRHLQGERDILDAQEELITEGFKEYAKL